MQEFRSRQQSKKKLSTTKKELDELYLKRSEVD
jgi:hypothetical protein